MISVSSLLTAVLLSATSAVGMLPTTESLPGCGEVNVFMTGLPAYHPWVISLGLDPAMVDRMLREDAARIVNMGYNLRGGNLVSRKRERTDIFEVAVFGPEEDYDRILKEQMCAVDWHGTGVGFGLRAGQDPDLTIQFEDIIAGFHERAPGAPIMFNYNAKTFSWAVQRRLPLAANCTDSPGKDLASRRKQALGPPSDMARASSSFAKHAKPPRND
ncbi:uncharacterized protein F5Z01DRAFT_690903 [Emericellopsis atlantica]|uniref:Uncharacterized protein n=1 Tax=Emericellopsis atlantica TaxID=2614577 RepID=A0A9P7ZHJ3_9HYPO|nr:uncharacterized protein F5Z01DRAFT_690903 [Emericellopsis atlantica]KAG9252189.1 hypothetical protein F5Z01DRAFT_690903 [Emericellopsis atlantica]